MNKLLFCNRTERELIGGFHVVIDKLAKLHQQRSDVRQWYVSTVENSCANQTSTWKSRAVRARVARTLNSYYKT